MKVIIVLLQLLLSFKGGKTSEAFKGSLGFLLVLSQMPQQARSRRIGTRAEMALAAFFRFAPSVGHLVAVMGRFIRKGGGTIRAFEGKLARVENQVTRQTVFFRERGIADVAFVRFWRNVVHRHVAF